MRWRKRPGGLHRLGIVLLVLTTACGEPGGSATPDPVGDPTGSWQLVAGTSRGVALPVPPDHPITLTLEPSRIGGVSACNSYGGEFTFSGAGIEMGQIERTLRGCEDALEVAERAYLDALLRVSAIGTANGHLVLSGRGIELRFKELAPPPTAQLVDTVWLLETVLVGEVASAAAGEPATLLLRSNGTFEGGTGCRGFAGQWTEDGARLVATRTTMHDVACPEALRGQDSHVVSVIGDGFVPTVAGDVLTLADPDGAGLVYRASE